MKEKPTIIEIGNGGKYYTKTFESFQVKVYIPKCDLPCDVVNFGFITPYLLVFEEHKESIEKNIEFADSVGLSAIAKRYGGSVLFVYPTSDKGWDNASKDLFADLINETRISEFYEDGVARIRDRFTGEWGEMYIRGALHRSCLYGYGKSADYIATNCLKTIEGNGLYGPGDITPAVCILQNLSVIPKPERRDLPIVSIANSNEINAALRDCVDYLYVKDSADYVADFDTFIRRYRRMVGNINVEDLYDTDLVIEPCTCNVAVAPDNTGDYKDLERFDMGYVAFYNKGIMDEKPVPLVLCFHGGGDSAYCMVMLTDWYEVVARNDFLLVSVENHTRTTATEAMELLEHLKSKYNIDEERIYSTGFSMGGAKSWDMYEQYPSVFAGVAPMDATFELGRDVFGNYIDKPINEDVLVPVFYVGGEDSPLPELPFQEKKCLDRMAYVLKVNKAKKQCNISFDEQEKWENKVAGIDGDETIYDRDECKGSVLKMHRFYSEDGNCYTVFASATKQSHEMRYLNCKNAWQFLSQFKRTKEGNIEII